MDIKQLTAVINTFVIDKGWYAESSTYPQTPRNIAISVAVEAAEILVGLTQLASPAVR